MTTKKTFRWFPDANLSLSISPLVDTAKLGDGYEQRQRKGITPILEGWDLKFTGSNQEIKEIDNFLREHGGYASFHWKNPDEELGSFICRSWRRTREHGVISSLAATFEQVPEL